MKKMVAVIKGGKMRLEMEGFVGEACKRFSRRFEDALGIGDDAQRVDKPELHQVDEQRQAEGA